MSWLLELLIEGIREICSQFLVDMMDLITGMFTDLLSCDLSLFEDLFSVVKDLYKNAILPMGIAILLLILIWQLFKTMFGRGGVTAEDPVELVCRSCICLFMLVFARPIANYILEVAGTPYQWVAGTEIKVKSFSDFVSSLDQASASLGIDSLSISILLLIMQFVVAWNYFKMLFLIAERYVLLGVFSYTAPLAFSTGGSKATNNILASWSKMFGGQVILIIMNAWCMKMFLSGYGNLTASHYGFTKFFIATLCLIGFSKVCFKLDSYMASLGINLGRVSNGLGALSLMLAAGRLFSFGNSHSSAEKAGGGEAVSTGNGETMGAYSDMGSGAGPIPMGAGNSMEEMGEEYMSGNPQEEGYTESMDNNNMETDETGADNILDEMGIGSQQDSMANETNPEESTDNYGLGEGNAFVDGEMDKNGSLQEVGRVSDHLEDSVQNAVNTEDETATSSYAEGMGDTNSIPMESESGQEELVEGGATLDYPREDKTETEAGMDLDTGTISEGEMNLESVTSGSAEKEYPSQDSPVGAEASGDGILSEIGETSIPASKGESTIPKFSEGSERTGEYQTGRDEIVHGIEKTSPESLHPESVESNRIADQNMFQHGQNLKGNSLSNGINRVSEQEDGIGEIPKSRQELRKRNIEDENW